VRFEIFYTEVASRQLDQLEQDPGKKKRYQSVRKAIGLMETNLRHPSLQTHKYQTLQGVHGEDVFESYAENKTPAAYRIFWHYGPNKGQITIVAITPHP
jgi:hypothetical protein